VNVLTIPGVLVKREDSGDEWVGVVFLIQSTHLGIKTGGDGVPGGSVG